MLKRKFTAVFTALLAAFSAMAPQFTVLPVSAADASASVSKQTGDVNLDGIVNTDDIQLLQNYVLSGASLTAKQKENSDMDGNGSLNVSDLTLLKKEQLNAIGNEKYDGLMINEVCSSAKKSVTDAAGASPDWIELYNASDKTITLDGIGVSDGAKNRFKFVFPEGTTIPADGYLLIYCDDAVNQAEGEYHAAFKISATGETIYLTHPLYGEIDSVAIPELDTDVAYGRYANGSDTFAYLSCTPAKSNDGATDLKLVEKPVFSVEGGFYDAAFDLALTDENGNKIYYTTDGSDPTASDTAKLYSGTINIYNNTSDPNVWSAVRDISLSGYNPPSTKVDKGIVIRAVCKTADGRYSDVAANSYFVGKTASYYSEMKVISLMTDSDYLFDNDTGAYMVGSGYYEWKNSDEYIEYTESDVRNQTNYNKDGREAEFPVTIQVFEDGKSKYISDVGARIAGNWSRVMPQKSIRLYARSEYGDSKMRYAFFENLTDANSNPIEEFDKITLRNGGSDFPMAHSRDAMIQEIAQNAGLSLDYMASEPCIVFIDGEFWGFYMIREKVDGDYIESHYGIDKDDAVVIKNGYIEEGTDADVTEFDEFCKWAAAADLTDPTNYQKVCDSIDIESLMDYIAVETYICNEDWSLGYLNNYMLWKSRTVDPAIPKADGKWRFVLYDTEMAIGMYGGTNTSPSFDMLNSMYKDAPKCNYIAVFFNLLNNADFKERFYNNYIDVVDNCFDPEAANAVVNRYVTEYGKAIDATHTRFNFKWVKSVKAEADGRIIPFFNNRPYYAKLYLDKLCNTATVNPEPDNPDPEVDTTTNLVSSVSKWTNYGTADFIADANNEVYSVSVPAAGTKAWDVQSQAPGITLKKGSTYLLTFDASCTTDVNMTLGLMHYYNSEYTPCWYGSAALTSEMQSFSYVFTNNDVTDTEWYLYFNYANAAGDYVIQNVRLVEAENLINNASSWLYYNPTGESALTVTDANHIVIDVTTLPDNTYDAQANCGGFSIQAGETYTYSFTVESTAETQLKAKIQQNSGSYTNYSNLFPEIGPEASTWTVTFTATEDCSDARISFNCGYAVGTYTISDIICVQHNASS
ncbi:MAG: CotH kinase family protein [Ruminococcus sp.]|nr:CotH kinase family protein [Ruminococcus sp.]